ncbi:MAG: DUF3341 domain-containing protein [Polyangiaceae bacterium]
MTKSVIGIVDSRPLAEAIITTLQTKGFAAHKISALVPDNWGPSAFVYEHHTKAPEGAVAGAAGGGILGGTLGLLAGIGVLVVPGLGDLVATGPFLSLLGGLAAGATVGGLSGGLIGLGIPEIEAKKYEGKVRGGNILLAVQVATQQDKELAAEILELGGAHDVGATTELPLPSEERFVQR